MKTDDRKINSSSKMIEANRYSNRL